PPTQASPAVAKPPRLWPAVALVGLYWILFFVMAGLDKAYFIGFLYNMASAALLTLLYFAWWWTNRQIRLLDRLTGFLLIVGAGVVVDPLCHPSIGWFGLLISGLPIVLTAWTLWMLLAKKTPLSRHWLGSLVVVSLAWGWFTLVRIDGVNA